MSGCHLYPGKIVEVCNVMQMARTGGIGEVRLGVFSVGAALEKARKQSGVVEVSANGLALLRCDLEIQKRLLFAIYGADGQ